MSGVLFLLAVTCIVATVLWSVQNDTPGIGGGAKGLFAMLSGDEDDTLRKKRTMPRWKRWRTRNDEQ
jgi:hypothetical protein